MRGQSAQEHRQDVVFDTGDSRFINFDVEILHEVLDGVGRIGANPMGYEDMLRSSKLEADGAASDEFVSWLESQGR